MTGLDDGGSDPELVAALGHGFGQFVSVGQGVGVVGEPGLSASLLCGQRGVAGFDCLQTAAVLASGSGEVPRSAVATGVLETIGGPAQLP